MPSVRHRVAVCSECRTWTAALHHSFLIFVTVTLVDVLVIMACCRRRCWWQWGGLVDRFLCLCNSVCSLQQEYICHIMPFVCCSDTSLVCDICICSDDVSSMTSVWHVAPVWSVSDICVLHYINQLLEISVACMLKHVDHVDNAKVCFSPRECYFVEVLLL